MASVVAVELLGCSGAIRRSHPATGLLSRDQCLRYYALLNNRRTRVAQTQYVMTRAGLGGFAPTFPPNSVDCSRLKTK
jgi:hypothetical protein